ncbi:MULTISPECIES: DUF547 domain-containing protein [Legionella]
MATYMRFICLAFCLLITHTAMASFHKNLWVKWGMNNPLSQKTISHKEWQDFLNCCVITNQEGINLVNYSKLTKADHDLLKRYIKHMSEVDIFDYNRNEQLAFWLNLYNALTVQTVAHYYPVASIQEINISPGLFSVGPWGANLITINDTQLSLEDIHNRIIRPVWNDPRTHYAINNGTIGAPNLSKQAFQANLLEKQLNDAAFRYINSLRGVQVIEGKIILSKIYEWFLEDFGGDEEGVLQHLTHYAHSALSQQLQSIQQINSYVYNWHLNSTAITA